MIRELEVPGSNRRAALLIACATGQIWIVEKISQEYKDEGLTLPLHRMITIAMENSQVDTTAFCLQKGATVDNSEARYAAWIGRFAEMFGLLFPYDIFHLKEEPSYIQQLLKDMVDPLLSYPANCLDPSKGAGDVFLPTMKPDARDLRPLFEFLVDRGAEVTADSIEESVKRLPYGAIEKFLPRFQGTLDARIERMVKAISGYSMHGHLQRSNDDKFGLFSLLLGRVSDSYNFSSLLEGAIRYTPSFVDLLLS